MAGIDNEVCDAFNSRMYRYVRDRKDKSKGGKGIRSGPTTVIRVPWEIGAEIDDLIFKYCEKINQAPQSPRHSSLKKFLEELKQMMP